MSGEILNEYDEEKLLEELRSADKVSESGESSVYLSDDHAFKIRDGEKDIVFRSCRLSNRIVPDTGVLGLDLNGFDGYDDIEQVIVQDRADEPLYSRIQEGSLEQKEAVGEVINLLDSAVEENIAIVDPVVENFAFFDGDLKLFDYTDIEAVEIFPYSYEEQAAEKEFEYAVRNMYEDAIASISIELDEETFEIGEAFVETSKYLESVETDRFYPRATISELPIDYI